MSNECCGSGRGTINLDTISLYARKSNSQGKQENLKFS